MKVKFNTVEGISYVPQKATKGSAAYDLRAAEDCCLFRSDPVLVPTGIHFSIPDGFCLLVFNRSGLGRAGVLLANGVGVIDSDYRGEVKVPMIYVPDHNDCYDRHHIKAGDRIAQCMLMPTLDIEFEWEDNLEETERGEGGFGSTGV